MLLLSVTRSLILVPDFPSSSIFVSVYRFNSFNSSSHLSFFKQSKPNDEFCKTRSRKTDNNLRNGVLCVKATSRESPYEVLGLSPSANDKEIKMAYRKLALKFHPDVNKEPNANDKFMRIKHAYNTLLNSKSRSKYDTSNGDSYYRRTSERSKNKTTQEDFYGFGDFFRDLQTEYANWDADSNSQGKPKSLWEELADIGEEFVEFLEKELNINDLEGEPVASYKNKSTVKSEEEKQKSDARAEVNKDNRVEDNIDEIEATLAQLKKELGL